MGQPHEGSKPKSKRTIAEIAREKILERDEEVPSPEVRAGIILEKLREVYPDINNWDLLCFCAEFLGSQIHAYPWLEEEAVKLIARRVNFAHYVFDEPPESGITSATQ